MPKRERAREREKSWLFSKLSIAIMNVFELVLLIFCDVICFYRTFFGVVLDQDLNKKKKRWWSMLSETRDKNWIDNYRLLGLDETKARERKKKLGILIVTPLPISHIKVIFWDRICFISFSRCECPLLSDFILYCVCVLSHH